VTDAGEGSGSANSNGNGTGNAPPPLAGGGWGEGAAPSLLARARTLRRDATPAERRLWQALRKHQRGGRKFRRQVPLGPFIADFYCPAARLVVEVDGVSHIDSPTDARRDAWMRKQGIRVFRIANFEVLSNLEGVLLAIDEAAGLTPPPQPPPARGGGVIMPPTQNDV
jgi:very-short-patch-repair endonuclease